MLGSFVQAPAPFPLTWPVSPLILPALALVAAAVLVGVVVYGTLVRTPAYRRALRVVEGRRTGLRLKAA